MLQQSSPNQAQSHQSTTQRSFPGLQNNQFMSPGQQQQQLLFMRNQQLQHQQNATQTTFQDQETYGTGPKDDSLSLNSANFQNSTLPQLQTSQQTGFPHNLSTNQIPGSSSLQMPNMYSSLHNNVPTSRTVGISRQSPIPQQTTEQNQVNTFGVGSNFPNNNGLEQNYSNDSASFLTNNHLNSTLLPQQAQPLTVQQQYAQILASKQHQSISSQGSIASTQPTFGNFSKESSPIQSNQGSQQQLQAKIQQRQSRQSTPQGSQFPQLQPRQHSQQPSPVLNMQRIQQQGLGQSNSQLQPMQILQSQQESMRKNSDSLPKAQMQMGTPPISDNQIAPNQYSTNPTLSGRVSQNQSPEPMRMDRVRNSLSPAHFQEQKVQVNAGNANLNSPVPLQTNLTSAVADFTEEEEESEEEVVTDPEVLKKQKILAEQYIKKEQQYKVVLEKQQARQNQLLNHKRQEVELMIMEQRNIAVNGPYAFGIGYNGYGNGYTGQRFQIVLPSRRKRVRKSREFKFPREKLREQANQEEFLVPIRLEVDGDGQKLRDTFTWNVNETTISYEHFAEVLCEDFHLPVSAFVPAIASSIKEQVEDFMIHNRKPSPSEVSDVPEDSGDAEESYEVDELEQPFEGSNTELRIPIKIDITVGNVSLLDQFEWDINCPKNDPELFAEVLANELGLGGEFKTAIAHSIREQIYIYVKSLILLGYSFDGSPIYDGDLASSFLPNVISVIRDEELVDQFTPMLVELTDAEVEKLERDRERETRRKRRQNRGRRGVVLPDRDPPKTSRSLFTSPSVDNGQTGSDASTTPSTPNIWKSHLSGTSFGSTHSAAPILSTSNLSALSRTSARIRAKADSPSRTTPVREVTRRTPSRADKGLDDWACANCGCSSSSTPLLRKGPSGEKTLCNACGLYYQKNNTPRPVKALSPSVMDTPTGSRTQFSHTPSQLHLSTPAQDANTSRIAQPLPSIPASIPFNSHSTYSNTPPPPGSISQVANTLPQMSSYTPTNATTTITTNSTPKESDIYFPR
ncbi:SWI/SNF chromatin-remodeling complex subunit [Basidiobolus ranarum]|uniref:SWI/SNF chromatin-remodeling complex subunit n=1 Tax=Basidiobolus ranarum TaxID=34480 RepID=A0ABR2WX79_9FUNG